ncbi:hypothetical protein N0V83_003540 [Neocucurbitaria cava]|uniref:Uncharacterized protein n=1 Tax=Neocucurbitaria cava TaxID=798079 RepID=A0A9W9CPD9_9PLEO|nr:hypothetical protein N0V83_003540 [Neocucurbitaria cava]
MNVFVLLGCIGKSAGIANLYWISVSHGGISLPTASALTEIRVGYFSLCTTFANDKMTCFSRETVPDTSPFLPLPPLLLACISLQKRSLYPLPALASPLFLFGMIYYFTVRERGGRNKKAAKALLGISAALGLASALACMASAKALEGAEGVIGGNVQIKSGMWLGVLLWIAAAIHVSVVGYLICGMPGSGMGGGYGGSSGGGYDGGLRGGGGDSLYGASDAGYTEPAGGYGAPPGSYPPSSQGPSSVMGGPEIGGGYGNPHMVVPDPYTTGGRAASSGRDPLMVASDSYTGGAPATVRNNAPLGGARTWAPPRAGTPLIQPPAAACPSPYSRREDLYMSVRDPYVGGATTYGIGSDPYAKGNSPAMRGAAPTAEEPAHYAGTGASFGGHYKPYPGGSLPTRQLGAPSGATGSSLGDRRNPHVRDGGLRYAGEQEPRIGENGEAPSQAINSPTSGAVSQPNSANSFTQPPPPQTSDQLYMANALDALPSSKPSKPWRRAISFKNARPLKASKTATGREPLKVAFTLKAAEPTKEDEVLSADETALKPTNEDDDDASRSTAPVKDGEEAINTFSKTVKSDLKAAKRRTPAKAKPFKPTISLLGTKPTTLEAKKEPKIPTVPTSANGLSGKEPPSWGLCPNLPLSSKAKAAKPTTPVEAKEINGQEPLAWGLGPASVPTIWGNKKTVTKKLPKVGDAEEVKGQEPSSWGLGPSTAGTKWATKWKPHPASKKDVVKTSSRSVTPARAVTPPDEEEVKDGVLKVGGGGTKTVTPIKVSRKTRVVQPRRKVKPVKAKKEPKAWKARREKG